MNANLKQPNGNAGGESKRKGEREENELTINGQTLRTRKEHENQLACLRLKAASMCQDMQCVADILAEISEATQSEQQRQKDEWRDKIRGKLISEDMKWPTWDEVTDTFCSIERLEKEIESLSKKLEPFLT